MRGTAGTALAVSLGTFFVNSVNLYWDGTGWRFPGRLSFSWKEQIKRPHVFSSYVEVYSDLFDRVKIWGVKIPLKAIR